MPFTSPKEFVEALAGQDSAALAELRRRYRGKLVEQSQVCVEQFGLLEDTKRLADRLLRVLELWLKIAGSTSWDAVSWEGFDKQLERKALELVTQPYEYERQFAGSLRSRPSVRNPKPLRGMCPVGQYMLRWFSKPLDQVTGDLWDIAFRADKSVVLLVGDVTSHGLLAALVAQVIPDLFQECLRDIPDPVDLAVLRENLDVKLSPVLSPFPTRDSCDQDCFVQATLALFQPKEARFSALALFPEEAIRGQFEPSPAVPTWTLAMATDLLGTGVLAASPSPGPAEAARRASADSFDFPEYAEVVVASDGVFDQPLQPEDVSSRLGAGLIRDLPTLRQTNLLFHQVLHRWIAAVESAGHQADDACLVSVRHLTDNVDLVCRLMDGDAQAQADFAEQFKKLIWKWVHKLLKDRAQEAKENAFQEVFAHLWAQLPKYSGGNLASFVQRTVFHKLCDVVRSDLRSSGGGSGLATELEWVADRSPTPLEAALSVEGTRRQEARMSRLRESIGQLEPTDQELIRLRLEGVSIEGIAAGHSGVPGWSVRNIKYRLAKIMHRLAELAGQE